MFIDCLPLTPSAQSQPTTAKKSVSLSWPSRVSSGKKALERKWAWQFHTPCPRPLTELGVLGVFCGFI